MRNRFIACASNDSQAKAQRAFQEVLQYQTLRIKRLFSSVLLQIGMIREQIWKKGDTADHDRYAHHDDGYDDVHAHVHVHASARAIGRLVSYPLGLKQQKH